MNAVSLRRRVVLTRRATAWLVVAVIAVSGVMLVRAAGALARPPRGKYACFYQYRLGGEFFLGYLILDGPTNYHYTHAGHGAGTYTYSRKRLRFHSGPLKHEFGIDDGWHYTHPGRYYRIILQTKPGINGYAATCDGPHAK